jgi:DNA-directed RNA polymerase specialized sigma24 family protein
MRRLHSSADLERAFDAACLQTPAIASRLRCPAHMTDDLIQEGRLAVYRALPALLSRASVASDHLAALTYTCQRRAMVDWIRKCVQADRHHEANEPPSQTECWRALILVLFTRDAGRRRRCQEGRSTAGLPSAPVRVPPALGNP